MDLKSIRKLTLTINSIILLLVFGLAGFFFLCKASFLIWFSIPTTIVYLIGYVLIFKDRLDIYVRLVYFWLTLYMSVSTICLGYKFGFHLYCLSMIPIIFYTEYMAEKLNRSKINAIAVSGIIVTCYLISTGYAAYIGPIYQTENGIAGVFWLFNSGIVLFFLIVYSIIMLRMVGSYEKKLTDIAHTDRLTGLYNRHFMMTKLEDSIAAGGEMFVAMLDIDNFKKINDTYGHNAGDYVLETLSKIMRASLDDSEISRWGGEEFLILSDGNAKADGLPKIESLRKSIEEHEFKFEDKEIIVTITAGIAGFHKELSVDQWVKKADDRLYFGKNNGKNRVIIKTDAELAK